MDGMQVQQTTNEGHPYSFQVSGKEKTLELQARCVYSKIVVCIKPVGSIHLYLSHDYVVLRTSREERAALVEGVRVMKQT